MSDYEDETYDDGDIPEEVEDENDDDEDDGDEDEGKFNLNFCISKFASYLHYFWIPRQCSRRWR